MIDWFWLINWLTKLTHYSIYATKMRLTMHVAWPTIWSGTYLEYSSWFHVFFWIWWRKFNGLIVYWKNISEEKRSRTPKFIIPSRPYKVVQRIRLDCLQCCYAVSDSKLLNVYRRSNTRWIVTFGISWRDFNVFAEHWSSNNSWWTLFA